MHRTIPSSTFTAARGLSRAGLAVLGAMTCFASVQTANADVSVSHALVVTTRGELGIRLGENLYPIGMSTDQFILKYGRPARQSRNELEYPGKGLLVLMGDAGTVNGFIFQWEPRQLEGPVVPSNADVRTDTGIEANSTYEQVLTLQGKPEENVVQQRHRTLFYPFGIFEFQDGRLCMLRIGFGPSEHDQLIDAIRRGRAWHEQRARAAAASTHPTTVESPVVSKPSGPKLPEEAGHPFRDIASAQNIVFVVDATGSMLNKLGTVRELLEPVVEGLPEDRRFNVVVFNMGSCFALEKGRLLTAISKNKLKFRTFLDNEVVARGETNPVPAIQLAFSENPDLIYLITDGDFPANGPVLKALRDLNRGGKVKVSTIEMCPPVDLGVTEFTRILQLIAKENGGVYSYAIEKPPAFAR